MKAVEAGFYFARARTVQLVVHPATGPSLRAVSPSTVRRAIKGLGLQSCNPAQKRFLSTSNKEKHLQWAKAHLTWSFQWASVLFSDESSFLVRKAQSRRVWR